ncbi:MAG: hypothetical protein HY852_11125 [Bradyrhizobium sp.]|uniref:hypothetical protein n=1 Tax=Bradyrhizobium sp. TaxID=376 RepID=UPI0025C0B52C|nr:hypothetical protein [Bradyrhizobium sp.]MBI5262353.1 hypothetical protein [Bradyrhizobium sp.]
MFVVRLKRLNEDFDLKAFRTRKAALARFRTAQSLMIDGDLEDCELFEANAADPEQAMEMVNQGHATLVEANLEDPRPQPPVRNARQGKSSGKTKKRRTR